MIRNWLEIHHRLLVIIKQHHHHHGGGVTIGTQSPTTQITLSITPLIQFKQKLFLQLNKILAIETS